MKVIGNMTFFWGNADPFSNWHPSRFIWNDIEFSHAEQYMMYRKAMLFGDNATAVEILVTKNPRKQKALGRQVKPFVKAVWEAQSLDIVVEGLLCKFRQNDKLKQALLGTGNTTLVEASPSDNIWGIGLADSDPRALDPEQWLGENRLGIALMRVRGILRAEQLQQPQQGTLNMDVKATLSLTPGQLDEIICNHFSAKGIKVESVNFKVTTQAFGIGASERDEKVFSGADVQYMQTL